MVESTHGFVRRWLCACLAPHPLLAHSDFLKDGSMYQRLYIHAHMLQVYARRESTAGYVFILALGLKETSNNTHFESDNNEFNGDLNARISTNMHVHLRSPLLVLMREKQIIIVFLPNMLNKTF